MLRERGKTEATSNSRSTSPFPWSIHRFCTNFFEEKNFDRKETLTILEVRAPEEARAHLYLFFNLHFPRKKAPTDHNIGTIYYSQTDIYTHAQFSNTTCFHRALNHARQLLPRSTCEGKKIMADKEEKIWSRDPQKIQIKIETVRDLIVWFT